MDALLFEQSLSALFHGGDMPARELRLTLDQRDYLTACYPAARLSPMEDEGWYHVSWKEAQ